MVGEIKSERTRPLSNRFLSAVEWENGLVVECELCLVVVAVSKDAVGPQQQRLVQAVVEDDEATIAGEKGKRRTQRKGKRRTQRRDPLRPDCPGIFLSSVVGF